MALENTLVGVAGEYLVAGELTLRGFLASITLRNSRGIDIIASNADGTKSVSIQVKTNSSGKARWLLNKKSEEYFSKNHYYVFVALKELGARPDFYIVPSKIAADYITDRTKSWMSRPKRDGTKRKDTGMRAFYDEDRKYLEKWNLIKL